MIGLLTGIGIALPAFYGQSAERCEDRMRREAATASGAFAQSKDLSILPETVRTISDSIASEICKRISANREDDNLATIARKTANTYFSSALEDGTPANVPSLVVGFLGKKYGLARPDFRRFGVLSLTCEPESEAFAIEVDSQHVEPCGKLIPVRILVEEGSRVVRITHGGTTACGGSVTVSPGTESNCVCIYESETGQEIGVPPPIRCDQRR